MRVTVGDRVEVQPESAEAQGRLGTVEAVLLVPPSRYQVRWDNGRWSMIAATDGVLSVVSRRDPSPTRRRKTTPPRMKNSPSS